MRSVINLTPLVDVILILLFAFMIRLDTVQGNEMKQKADEVARQQIMIQDLESKVARTEEQKDSLAGSLSLAEKQVQQLSVAASVRERRQAEALDQVTLARDDLAAQMEAERQTMADLQAMLEATSEEGRALGTERENLISQISALTRERDDLREKWSESTRQTRELADAVKILKKENEALIGKLAEARAEGNARMKRLTETTDKLEEEQKRLRGMHLEAVRAKEDLAREIEAMKQERADLGRQLVALAGEIQRLNQTLVREREASEALKKDTELALKAAEARMIRSQDTQAGMERKILEAASELAAAREAGEKISREFQTALKQLEEAKAEGRQWRERLQVREDELEKEREKTARLESLDTKTAADIVETLLNQKTGIESPVNLQINFEFNSALLLAQGRVQADQLGQALSSPRFKDRSFTLIGHTDERGDEEFNLKLSNRRAEAVKEYLVEHFHLDPERIRTQGQGEAQPLTPGTTELDYALNRRVEVRLAPK